MMYLEATSQTVTSILPNFYTTKNIIIIVATPKTFFPLKEFKYVYSSALSASQFVQNFYLKLYIDPV